MTVPSTTVRATFTGNGVTTSFSYPHNVISAADLVVYQNGVLKSLGTHYTLSGTAPYSGGTSVQFVTAPAVADTVAVFRNPAITQLTDYVENDSLPVETIETALDKLTMIAQGQGDQMRRALRYPEAENLDAVAPTVELRAGRYLFANAVTGAFEWVTSIVTTALSQSVIGTLLNPRAAAEIAATVTPTAYSSVELTLSRYSATATTALTEAASVASQYSHARIIVDRDVALTANTTIPINATLVFDKGAVITPTTNITLTVLGSIEAGPRQIFDLAASGSLVAGPIKGKLLVEWWGAVGDGTGSGGGTDNATNIQRALTYVLANGGHLEFDAASTYRCDAGLTLMSSTSTATQKPVHIDYYNCLLDFTNLTGSAVGLKYGASSIAFAHEAQMVRVGNVRVKGPEVNGGPSAFASMTTTTTGVLLENCLHWTLDPHFVYAWFRGMHTMWSWNVLHLNHHVRNCYIGFHFDDTSTYSTFIGCAFMQCSVGTLFRSESGVVSAVATQTLVSCRWEGNDVHVHMDADPTTGSTYGVRDIAFIKPYFEDATYDWFRVGIGYDQAAAASVRQATNTVGQILNVEVDRGAWANNDLVPTSGTAAFCFDKDDLRNARVNGFIFAGPISLTQRCRGRASKMIWQNTVNQHHNTDNLESFEIGEASANLTMSNSSVTLGRSSGNILSLTHVADGVFDITFREGYSATAEYTVFGSADNRVVSPANTSATVCRVTMRDFAGTAAFAATAHLYVRGRMV